MVVSRECVRPYSGSSVFEICCFNEFYHPLLTKWRASLMQILNGRWGKICLETLLNVTRSDVCVFQESHADYLEGLPAKWDKSQIFGHVWVEGLQFYHMHTKISRGCATKIVEMHLALQLMLSAPRT